MDTHSGHKCVCVLHDLALGSACDQPQLSHTKGVGCLFVFIINISEKLTRGEEYMTFTMRRTNF